MSRMIEIGKLKLHNCDNMELMAKYPDNYFDLAVVDPEYGIGECGKSNHSRGSAKNANKWKGSRNTTGVGIPSTKFKIKAWDNKPADLLYFIELKRVSKKQIIWGANHFIENIPNANSSSWIVWDKVNGTTDFADCELAYTSFKTAVRKFTFMWNGMLQGNMKEKEKRIHPTQKPIALYNWIYKNYSKTGFKVLDTHLGSGSNAIAAHYSENVAEFVACELDKDYYTDMLKRVKEQIAQLKLF